MVKSSPGEKYSRRKQTIAKDRSLVRASDIGSWTFCHRAWWLANVKNAPHENPAAFERGDSMHNRHGRQVAMAGMTQRAGLLLIALALFLLAALLLWNYVLPS